MKLDSNNKCINCNAGVVTEFKSADSTMYHCLNCSYEWKVSNAPKPVAINSPDNELTTEVNKQVEEFINSLTYPQYELILKHHITMIAMVLSNELYKSNPDHSKITKAIPAALKTIKRTYK